MNFKDFNKMVKIEHIESHDCFGHYPMQNVIVKNDGSIEIAALLGIGIAEITQKTKKDIKNKAKEVYLSLDFPPTNEIKQDFILKFLIKNNKIEESETTEYNPANGDILRITKNDNRDTVKTIYSYFLEEGA